MPTSHTKTFLSSACIFHDAYFIYSEKNSFLEIVKWNTKKKNEKKKNEKLKRESNW